MNQDNIKFTKPTGVALKTFWPWNYHDIKCWKYIDYTVANKRTCNCLANKRCRCRTEPVITWIKNPEFAYEHLSPYNDNTA